MNTVPFLSPSLRQDAACAEGAPSSGHLRGREELLDLVHDLRQPLSDIDALAYYLQLISTDDRNLIPLQRIQAMVSKADRILAAACGCGISAQAT